MEILQPTRQEISKNFENAFEFIQRLYFESSYLIKEIEGQLAINDLKFQIVRPYGYGINTSKSTGLEINYVKQWLIRKFSVAFVEDKFTKISGGVSTTKIDPLLKVLFFRIILNDKNQNEPHLNYGVFHEIISKSPSHVKFESLLSHFESYDYKIFNKLPDIDYENTHFSIKGKFKRISLLDINSSEELVNRVIDPVLKIYKDI